MANLMFDDQLRTVDHAKYNSLLSRKNLQYYLTMSAFHGVSFMYLAYFFRFRRVNFAATVLLSSAYYYYFQKTNNIAYKWIVDRHVLGLARELGHQKHIQPIGHFKNRGLNYI